MSIDRFTGIVYPFHHRLRPVSALFAIIFIWLLAFAIIFPSAATLTVIRLDDIYMVQDNQIYPLFVCFEDWPRADLRRVYTTVIFVHVYLAPLGLISIMYGCIAAKLSNNLRENRVRSRRRMKVIKMLIMVAILFMVSWLPLWTLMLLTDYQDLDRQQIDFLSSYLFPVAHWLAFFNSGVNPIIYGFFNENFRRGFQAAIACRSCSSVALEMRHTHFALPPSNKVSDGNRGVNSRQKDCCFPVMPQGTAHGIQGILLEDMNGVTASNRVIGAWME